MTGVAIVIPMLNAPIICVLHADTLLPTTRLP